MFFIDFLCPIHISLTVIVKGILQDSLFSISLFVFLDGFVVREGRHSLLSRSCLGQYPGVVEAGDVLRNEHSDRVEEADEWSL